MQSLQRLAVLCCALLFAAGAMAQSSDAVRRGRGTRPAKPPEAGAINLRGALGFGLDIPEFYPVEGFLLINRWVALRAFYVWPIPFNVRVEMPADVISKKGIIVEHPDLVVNFKALYGPQYGLEGLVFPWGGGFHVFAGASYRRLSLKGGVTSGLILRSEPNGPPLETNSSVRLYADASTAQYVLRGGVGYLLLSPMGIYFNVFLGYSKPYKAFSHIDVQGDVLNQKATNQEDVRAALDELKAVKEAEMEDKALTAMRPAEKLSLPIVGFSFGVYF